MPLPLKLPFKLKLPFPLPSLRKTSLLMSLFCMGVLVFAWYLQTYQGVEPCPLCIIQRIFFILLGIVFFLGALYTSPHKKGQRWLYGTTLLLCLMGGGVAGWQVHLQSIPVDPYANSCGADLAMIFENLPFLAAIRFLMQGTASCHEVTWTLFSLSIPEWSVIAFLGLAGVSVWQMRRTHNP